MEDDFDEELLDGLDLEDQLDLLLDHSFKDITLNGPAKKQTGTRI